MTTTVQTSQSEPKGSPLTIEQAWNFVQHVESLFMPWNIDALVDGFTEDCVVRFGTLPEFRGREALRAFFAGRSAKQKNYRLTKQLRTLMDDTITNVWHGTWQDADTGVAMRGMGIEIWVMEGGKIAVWEAAFNVGRVDQQTSLGDVLR